MKDKTIDTLDKRILHHLQSDCSLSNAELSEKLGVSSTSCWRRIQSLEKNGFIKQRVALLDRAKLNLGVDVFVAIKTEHHNAQWLAQFAVVVDSLKEVVEFYRMSGDIDYLMRVVVSDIESFDRFYKKLIEQVDLKDISSSFSMEQIKYTTALPLEHL